MLEKIFALSLSLMILGQGYVVKRLVGTWLFPACIFSLFWFALTFLPIIIALDAPLSPLVILYILVASVLFSIASLRNGWRRAYEVGRFHYQAGTYSNPFMRTSLVALFFVAVIAHITNMYIQGFNARDLTTNIVDTAGIYTKRRYDENVIANVFSQIGLIGTYLAAMVGGLLVGDKEKLIRMPILIFLSFFPSLFLMVAQSAKGAIFLCIALFFGGILAVAIRTDRKGVFSVRAVTYATLFIPLFLILVGLSFVARLGSGYTGDLLTRYFVSYSSAHLFGFSDWLSWYLGNNSLFYYRPVDTSYGFFTVMPLFRLFGDDRFVPIGTYDEYFDYSFFLAGNIYTIFRGMIVDFGLGGSLIAIILFSRLVHWQFYRALTLPRASLSVACTIMAVGAIYHSYLASIGMYLSIYVCLIALAVILRLNATFSAKMNPTAVANGLNYSAAVERRL